MSYTYNILHFLSILLIIPNIALADEALQARAEINHRYGQERSITMTEFWVPFIQDDDSVLYGDLRMMGDNEDNREGNIGVGYRKITNAPILGEGIIGAHSWIDRRKTARGSTFHQATIGAEWLSDSVDVLANAYIPLSSKRIVSIPNANPQAPALLGTGIVIDTDGTIIEESQSGFDIELGYQVPFLKDQTDSFRIYGGGYYFDGDNTQNVAGLRTRFTADINTDFQIGARFQRDDERGSQGFLEATLRFPFGQKKSYRHEGLRARLDDAPERDIDIVTGEQVTDTGDRVVVVNQVTGQAQEVLHIDNTAAGGGDGSAETPFNTLAAAQGASSAQTIIYVNRGDGTTAGQNAGIMLDKTGQQLIGSGTNFIYDGSKFTTANGSSPSAILIKVASTAPMITNAGGNGVDISADDITVAGITVDGAAGQGINITNANHVIISDVNTANNTNNGIYANYTTADVYDLEINNSAATGNTQRGFFIRGAAASQITATFEDNTASGNQGHGFLVRAYDTSQAATTLTGNTSQDNTGGWAHGFMIISNNNSIVDVTLVNNISSGNTKNGFNLQGNDDGNLTATLQNNTSSTNLNRGFYIEALIDSQVTAILEQNTATSNTTEGFYIDDNSTLGITADMGGGALGSTGGNRAYNNTLHELRVDLDGGELKAENNWWGDPTGLPAGELALNGGSTADTDPYLSADPGP